MTRSRPLIAVIGATGMLGRPVTEGLLATGFPVRIVARNPENAKRPFPGTKEALQLSGSV